MSTSAPFAGLWRVEHATLPNGDVAYTGTIDIQAAGDVFRLAWDISAGSYVGIGMRYRDRLYVSCGEHFENLGIALYTLDAGGSLSGRWSTAELNGAIGSATPAGPPTGKLIGTHIVQHVGPGGQPGPVFELSIAQHDQIYELSWSSDAGQLTGLGLAIDGGVAAGWYPDLSQLAFLDYWCMDGARDRLHALWALGGYTTLGTERLTRN